VDILEAEGESGQGQRQPAHTLPKTNCGSCQHRKSSGGEQDGQQQDRGERVA